MTNLLTIETFKLYAICSVILGLNLVGLAIGTAISRAMSKTYLNPEDGKVNGKDSKLLQGPEHDLPGRFGRAHRNAIENILPFFAIGLIYVLTDGTLLGAKAYFFTFTAARVLHSVFYVKGIQPLRTMSFFVALLCLLGMMAHILRVAF
jgi:uncharacterized MAPEG superfamily protein